MRAATVLLAAFLSVFAAAPAAAPAAAVAVVCVVVVIASAPIRLKIENLNVEIKTRSLLNVKSLNVEIVWGGAEEKEDAMSDAVDAIVGQWAAERPDLRDGLWAVEVLARVQRMNRLVEKQFKTFAAERDLEMGEVDILFTLRRSGPPYSLTAGALIPAAMVTSGAITNRIDRMEAKGLVERVRDDKDRRSVRIRLTDHSLKVTEALMADHLAHYAQLLAPLDPGTCTTVADALRTLLEAGGDTSLT